MPGNCWLQREKQMATGTNDIAAEPGSARRLITLPNLLSLSRLVLLPFILLLLFRRQGIGAVTLMAVCWLTDALDGIIARRLNQVSNLGRALDHLVDKIWIGTVLVVLVCLRGLPLWLAGTVILRDLLILAGSVAIMHYHGTYVSSDIVGKVAGAAFAVAIVYYTLEIPRLAAWRQYLDIAIVVLAGVSLINYGYRFLQRMTGLHLPDEEQNPPENSGPRRH